MECNTFSQPSIVVCCVFQLIPYCNDLIQVIISSLPHKRDSWDWLLWRIALLNYFQLQNMQRSSSDLKLNLQLYKKKQEKWSHQKEMLLKTITLLQQQVNKYKAINNNLLKKSKHKRASSQQQTFIFNQTNISSYYPIVVVKNNNWVHKANLRSHLDSVRTLLIHNGLLVTGSEDCTLKIWEKEQLRSTHREHLGPIYAMTTTQDLIFTAGAEGVIRKWSTAELLSNLSPHFQGDFHEEPIWDLISNQKRKLLLSSSADQTHKLFRWSLEGMEELWTNKVGFDTPTSVDWIGDTRFISGFVNSEKLGVYDIQTAVCLSQYHFEGKDKYFQTNKIQYNSKQKIIVAAHEDHCIRFFDPNSNKKIKELTAHSDAVTSVLFRPEEFELVSCGHDGNLRFWDLRKYKCISDVAVHMKKYDEGALCLAQNKEEDQLCVGGADGLVKIIHQQH